jgi:CheY-like chemotaxis protein
MLVQSHRPMKVLFVDDDSDDRDFFVDALSYVNPSIECDLAKNCDEAFEILKTKTLPQYVFLDIHMPVSDGKSCLIQIREDQRLKDVKVVMYSTTSDEELIEEYKKLGATYFLIKPLTFKGLCDSLTVLFGN